MDISSIRKSTRKKDTLATSQRCWIPNLVCSVLWRSVIMLLSCCLPCCWTKKKKRKTQDSFQELFWVWGDVSFDLYPGCQFLRNHCSVYYTDTSECRIFSKWNFFCSLFIYTTCERDPGTLCLGDFTLNQPSRGDCWISHFCKVLTLLCQLLRDYILYILPRPRNSFFSSMKDMSLKLLHQIEFMQYILVLL